MRTHNADTGLLGGTMRHLMKRTSTLPRQRAHLVLKTCREDVRSNWLPHSSCIPSLHYFPHFGYSAHCRRIPPWRNLNQLVSILRDASCSCCLSSWSYSLSEQQDQTSLHVLGATLVLRVPRKLNKAEIELVLRSRDLTSTATCMCLQYNGSIQTPRTTR